MSSNHSTTKHQVHHCKQGHEHAHDVPLMHLFGKNTELVFAVLSGIFFFMGLALNYLFDDAELYAKLSFGLSLFLGGYFVFFESIEVIKKGQIDIHILMLVAAVGAVYIEKWGEASLLLFLFSLGHALEHFAMNRARRNIEMLSELSPDVALLKTSEGNKEVPIADIRINDIILVQPHTKIAADGVIIKGSSSINQASITGESMPVDKTAIANPNDAHNFSALSNEYKTFAGSVNGDHALEVKVLKLSENSTISRMVAMVSDLDSKRSEVQQFAKKFEKWYVPAVIVFVLLLCLAFLILDETASESLYRAITVLVAASPCALAISTPSAVLSGVARAAKSGVLIKGGMALESLGSIQTIAFDKTGTLTEGKPQLTYIESFENIAKDEFLQIVQDVESLSNHPLAKAISTGITEKYNILSSNHAQNIEAIQGMGITADYNDKVVLIGNQRLMETYNVLVSENSVRSLEERITKGQTSMLVAYDNQLIGMLSVMDLPRVEALNTLKRLKAIGIKHMVMLTGDHKYIGETIAEQIGLTEVKGDLLPEDKVKAISELKASYKGVAMVGDGVNDAPAMANATVGVAMGVAGSDVALETADIALMSDKIEKLPFVIGLSRATNRIIRQNLWISLGVVALLVPATLFGFASIGPAVIFHEGSTLVVVLNALRLLVYKDK